MGRLTRHENAKRTARKGDAAYNPGAVRPLLTSLVLVAIGACAPPQNPTVQPQALNPASRYRIAWATYLGGPLFDQLREVLVMKDGSILVAGQASSAGLPTTPGVVQPRYAGDDQPAGKEGAMGGDCYLARLSADGARVLAGTYFGGSKQERNVYGLAVDRAGNVVITSATRSMDIPTTKGCFQPRYGGGKADWFVAKLSPDLTRTIWCTYVGGSLEEFPRGGLVLDANDDVVVVGPTPSPDFPATDGAFQKVGRGKDDVGIVKLKADGSGVVFATRVGGSNDEGVASVAMGADGGIWVGGHTASVDFPTTAGAFQRSHGGRNDGFLIEMSPDGSRLLRATLIGGSGDEFTEHGLRLAPDGTVLVTGGTASPDFPGTAGAFQPRPKADDDAFVGRFRRDLGACVFLSCFGGGSSDDLLTPMVGPDGNVWAVGFSSSPDLAVTADALMGSRGGSAQMGVVAAFAPDGAKIVYATYVGGDGDTIVRNMAFGTDDSLYLVGGTKARNFPVTAGAVQTRPGGGYDGFVMKLVPAR